MAKLLLACASDEGQTVKVVDALARQLVSADQDVRAVMLDGAGASIDTTPYDGFVVAASVHAGRHQRVATRFVLENIERLRERPSAFLSVSLSAAASDKVARHRAVEQADAFLRDCGWQPDLIETVAGAVRPAALSPPLRWAVRLGRRLFAAQLDREGWPDMSVEREFTDWDALRVFGLRYLAVLEARAKRRDGERASAEGPSVDGD